MKSLFQTKCNQDVEWKVLKGGVHLSATDIPMLFPQVSFHINPGLPPGSVYRTMVLNIEPGLFCSVIGSVI